MLLEKIIYFILGISMDETLVEKVVIFFCSVAVLMMYYIFFKRFLGLKRRSKYFILAVIIVFTHVPVVIVRVLHINAIYQEFIGAIFDFIIALLIFKGSNLKKLTAVVIYNCFSQFTQYLSVPVIYIAYLINIEGSIYYTNIIRTIILQTSYIMYNLLFIIILDFISKHFYMQDNFRNFKYILLFIIPNIFIVTILNEFFKEYYLSDFSPHRSLLGNIKMIAFSSMSLICGIFMVIILEKLILENNTREKEFKMKQQLNMQVEHYKNLQVMLQSTRMFKHDLNNHLICIKNLVKQKNVEETLKYIDKISDSLAPVSLKINTGNSVSDAIINEKYSICMDKNIEFYCNIKIPSRSSVDPFDMCVILGNSLDNAIEACDRITDCNIKKYIHLSSIIEKSFLVIEIKNSMQGYIENYNISTSKSDNINHGIGLTNIKNTISKYSGTTYIETAKDVFILSMMLQV